MRQIIPMQVLFYLLVVVPLFIGTPGRIIAQDTQIVAYANLDDGDLVSIGKKVVLTFEAGTPMPPGPEFPSVPFCPLPANPVTWTDLETGLPVGFWCRYFQNLDRKVRLLIEPFSPLEPGQRYRVIFDQGPGGGIYQREFETLGDNDVGRYAVPMPPTNRPPFENEYLSIGKPAINALGFDLEYNVYLPPGYDRSDSQRYPVVLALHGLGSNFNVWRTAKQFLDDDIQRGYLEPMIVIFPDGMVGWGLEEPWNDPDRVTTPPWAQVCRLP